MSVRKGDQFIKGRHKFLVDSITAPQLDGTPESAVLIDEKGESHLVPVTELESGSSGWTRG